MAKICPRCSELLPDDAVFCPFDGTAVEAQADKFLGKTIAARYRLVRKLGSGGMSMVYLARHELISRLSALKIMRPELSRVPEHRERFLREARAVNRINHENIVEITDVGESDGAAYLVMEYVEGESLLAQIQQGPMRWERAVLIAIQVASALARTHQMGIIHRDLKPENILLVPRKPGAIEGAGAATERVKLIDFGIAKMTGEATLTMNEQLFGTPGYIAPEYVSGLAIDGRADIYSLGVVLYEMVTGELPFEGKGQSDLLLKPLTTSPIPPSQRIGGLPGELEALLMKCLKREPNERFHDAFALHDALVAIIKHETEKGSIAPPPPETLDEPPVGAAAASVAPRRGREASETVVDLGSSPELAVARETAAVDKMVTNEMSARWSDALGELEKLVAAAEAKGGDFAATARRANDLAIVASEMIPRIERATKVVASRQAKVDELEAIGRAFRAELGNAIDVLVHDRSRERAHLDQLRARRAALESVLDETIIRGTAGPPSLGSEDPRPFEVEALHAAEGRAEATVKDLTFQIEALQKQLDERNEAHERALVQATGTLEGSLSAFRHLTNEIARTIDDGIDMLKGISG
ncbi:MAG: protein kinase [Labilithrix sp.]|nr:protein kinase [Labilithrix sp.]MCW5817095.1 protein kinase [Labilithrix sp.]